MFSGRVEELLSLDKILFQTKNGNPQHFAIVGDRGIGKSSLLFYLDSVAKGSIESLSAGTFRFLTVNVEFEPATDYSEIVRKVGKALQRGAASVQTTKAVATAVWDFLKRWEVAGVKYTTAQASSKSEMLEDLADALIRSSEALTGTFDGILILIDEADKPDSTAHLGEFAKLLTERLSKAGCNNVGLGLAGLPALLPKLRRSHESSLRVFEMLTLAPLLPDERIAVISKGLDAAEERNGYRVTIEPAAEQLISMLSEGYPHFIQQFAYCSFEADTDNTIDVGDVSRGAFGENGAFTQLGVKYFEGLYFDQISSTEYRRVLRAMAQHGDGWVKRSAIQEATGLKASTLNNALNALKKRDIIQGKPGRTGEYRLPSNTFAVWIRGFTSDDADQPPLATD